MFQQIIHFANDSSLEVASRIHNNEDKVILTITGKKSKSELTSSSLILSDEHLSLLVGYLQDALGRTKSWPPQEEKVS